MGQVIGKIKRAWSYITHIETASSIGQITLPVFLAMFSIGVTNGIGLWQEYHPLIIWFAVLFCIPLAFYISEKIGDRGGNNIPSKTTNKNLFESIIVRDRDYLSSFIVVTERNFDLTNVTGEGGFITFNFWIFNGSMFTIRIKNQNTGRIICDKNPQAQLPDLRGELENKPIIHGYNQRIEIRQFISSSLGQHLMGSNYVASCSFEDVRFPLEIIDDPEPKGRKHYLKLRDITIKRDGSVVEAENLLAQVSPIRISSFEIEKVVGYRYYVQSISDKWNDGDTPSRGDFSKIAVDYEHYVHPVLNKIKMREPGEIDWHGFIFKFENPIELAIKEHGFGSVNQAITFLDQLIGRLQHHHYDAANS